MWSDISPYDVTDNLFRLIGKDWFLITAGSPDAFNTMTASWGGAGYLWEMPVFWCVIRPQRYTYGFVEKNDGFTASFFEERYRPALQLCGSRSGREIDKAREAGLTPTDGGVPATTTFEEARLVFVCRKIYTHDIDPARFLDPAIDRNYPQKDYHRMVMGEIVRVASRD